MKALKYIGLGGLLVLLTIGCSDFLKDIRKTRTTFLPMRIWMNYWQGMVICP